MSFFSEDDAAARRQSLRAASQAERQRVAENAKFAKEAVDRLFPLALRKLREDYRSGQNGAVFYFSSSDYPHSDRVWCRIVAEGVAQRIEKEMSLKCSSSGTGQGDDFNVSGSVTINF